MPYWYIGGFGLFLDILFWILLIWLIVWLISSRNRMPEKDYLEIIKTRYARGEITKKQFDDMKKDLGVNEK